MKELNVIGTMQLLAACQKAPGLERLVVRSSTAVYGSSSRDPAMFTEDMAAKRIPASGFAKDVGRGRGLRPRVRPAPPRRRGDHAAHGQLVGPRVDSPLTQYFPLPVVPTVLGYDARLQFLHEDDLLAALAHATIGRGARHLQPRRRRRADAVPGDAPARPARPAGAARSPLGSLRLALKQAGVRATSRREQTTFLTYGRGVDTTRMREVLGFEPAYTTAQAFADFARSLEPGLLPSAGRAPR